MNYHHLKEVASHDDQIKIRKNMNNLLKYVIVWMFIKCHNSGDLLYYNNCAAIDYCYLHKLKERYCDGYRFMNKLFGFKYILVKNWENGGKDLCAEWSEKENAFIEKTDPLQGISIMRKIIERIKEYE